MGRTQGTVPCAFVDGNKTIEFKYDENGLRHRKIVKENDVVVEQYDYVWFDGSLISQTYTSFENGTVVSKDTARFIYDSWGTLQGFILNDSETYLYVKNLQGDIIAIVDEFGEVIVEYSYDAWGNVTFHETSLQNMTKASTLCFVSPFTYRGYCYDYDIELYYLQSRYYSAEIGRFINADSTDYLGATGTVLSFNLFSYCENNPVNYVDVSGTFAWSTVTKMLLGVLSQYAGDIIANIIAGERGIAVFKPTSRISQYISAAITALWGGNKLLSSIGRAAIMTAADYIQDRLEGKKQSLKQVLKNLLKNLIVDYVCSFISKVAIKKINSLSPKNYSSFANSKYIRSQKLTPKQITKRMQFLIRCNIFSAKVFDFLVGAIGNAV